MTSNVVANAGKPRLFAMIIDNLLASIASIVIAARIPGVGDISRGLILVAVYLLYFLLAEALWARTLGKLACGLAVLRSDGSRCGWKEAWLRTLLRIIEVNPLILGALPGGLVVIFSKRKQRMGDMLADTVVAQFKSRGRDV